MKHLLPLFLFIFSFACLQAQQDTLHNVLIRNNQLMQNVITAQAYNTAPKILDSVAKEKSFTIRLYVATGWNYYALNLSDEDLEMHIEDLLKGTGYFSPEQKQKRYQDSTQAKLQKFAGEQQTVLTNYVQSKQLKRTIFLNLTLFQMMRPIKKANDSIGSDYENLAKLQLLFTPDLEENITAQFAGIVTGFELKLTQNRAENDKILLAWLRGLGQKIGSPQSPCEDVFIDTVRVGMGLQTLNDYINFSYSCLLREKRLNKLNIACLCTGKQPNDTLAIGQVVKIPNATKEEEEIIARCFSEKRVLPNANAEVVIVENLATRYNRKVYAHNLQEYTRQQGLLLFKPVEQRPYWHIVAHGGCTSGELSANQTTETITKVDVKNFQIGTPELMWLHCCETAQAGKQSITQAFLDKGAKRGIGSLWNVEDGVVKPVVTMFYERYFANPNQKIEDILYQVRLNMINSGGDGEEYDALNRPRNFTIYDYFEAKYNNSFTDYGVDEAKVELTLNQDNETFRTTIKIKGKSDKIIDGLQKRYFSLLKNGIRITNTKFIVDSYVSLWKGSHEYLKSHHIKRIYLSLDDNLRNAIARCSQDELPCESSTWSFGVFKDDENSKYILEYYDIVLLH